MHLIKPQLGPHASSGLSRKIKTQFAFKVTGFYQARTAGPNRRLEIIRPRATAQEGGERHCWGRGQEETHGAQGSRPQQGVWEVALSLRLGLG